MDTVSGGADVLIEGSSISAVIVLEWKHTGM
jgi:hypothetical protein